MSSYFDEAVREIDQAAQQRRGDSFLAIAAPVEERVIRDVTLLTGDREFPDDLRHQAIARIAVLRCGPPAGCAPEHWPATSGRRQTEATCRSALVDALHSLWHVVAAQGVETRFGRLTDDPAADLAARNRHDSMEDVGACPARLA